MLLTFSREHVYFPECWNIAGITIHRCLCTHTSPHRERMLALACQTNTVQHCGYFGSPLSSLAPVRRDATILSGETVVLVPSTRYLETHVCIYLDTSWDTDSNACTCNTIMFQPMLEGWRWDTAYPQLSRHDLAWVLQLALLISSLSSSQAIPLQGIKGQHSILFYSALLYCKWDVISWHSPNR